MKKFLIDLLLIILVSMNFICCDNDTYKMPYKPGVTVDKENFLEHKELWLNSTISDYSYTYSFYNSSYPLQNCVIDVLVKDNTVESYEIKEFNKTPITEQTKPEGYDSFLEELNESTDFLLIDNIYSNLEETIDYSINKGKEYPECFYSDYKFDYLDQRPFFLKVLYTNLIMQEDLDGNGATVEIKIENFKEE